jgi:hypothetical protein
VNHIFESLLTVWYGARPPKRAAPVKPGELRVIGWMTSPDRGKDQYFKAAEGQVYKRKWIGGPDMVTWWGEWLPTVEAMPENARAVMGSSTGPV